MFLLTHARSYITVMRECYEGYVLYNFLRLMIFYCGGDAGLLEWCCLSHNNYNPKPVLMSHVRLRTRPAKRYAPPCCCISLQPGQVLPLPFPPTPRRL